MFQMFLHSWIKVGYASVIFTAAFVSVTVAIVSVGAGIWGNKEAMNKWRVCISQWWLTNLMSHSSFPVLTIDPTWVVTSVSKALTCFITWRWRVRNNNTSVWLASVLSCIRWKYSLISSYSESCDWVRLQRKLLLHGTTCNPLNKHNRIL